VSSFNDNSFILVLLSQIKRTVTVKGAYPSFIYRVWSAYSRGAERSGYCERITTSIKRLVWHEEVWGWRSWRKLSCQEWDVLITLNLSRSSPAEQASSLRRHSRVV